MKFITGNQLLQRWQIEPHELMQIITEKNSFNKELTPYSWEYFLPYEVQRPGDMAKEINQALFREEDVLLWEQSHNITDNELARGRGWDSVNGLYIPLFEMLNTGKTPAATPKTQTPEEYIKQSKKNKIKKEFIALELRDKFSLTLLEIGRKLKLDAGLQESQIDALKQRAKRLCEAGEKLKS